MSVSMAGVMTLIRSHGIQLRKGRAPDFLGLECPRAYFPVGARVLDEDIAYVVIDVEDEEEASAVQPAA
jgi:hypothetical protein